MKTSGKTVAMATPRNHVALALLKRGGGSRCHTKPHKAKRAQERQKARREAWL